MRKITGGIDPTGGWQTDTDSSSTTAKMSATASRRARCRYWPLRADAPRSGQRISPPTTAALHLRWQPVWSLCHHPCGEYCEEHPGGCVRDTQRGPEAEIGLRRQHTAEYQEQDSERCGQQQEKTGPANAGAPSPRNKNLPQQYRSNHQAQERKQEDRVANVALSSASRHGVELDAVPQGHCCQRECRNNDSGLSQSAQPVAV
jgi:hypothetical protein